MNWVLTGPPNVSLGSLATNSNSAVYTAPSALTNNTEYTATVIAASAADPSVTASAAIYLKVVTVTVSSAGGVTSLPATAGATLQFTATVDGWAPSYSYNMTWSFVGTAVGSINQTTGLYTAPTPAITGTQTVQIQACVATTSAPSCGTFPLTLTPVTPPPSTLTISPTSVPLNAYGTQTFTATLNNVSGSLVIARRITPTGRSTNSSAKTQATSTPTITWSLEGPGTIPQGATGATATYTAPAPAQITSTQNTATLTATAVISSSQTVTASATIILQPVTLSISAAGDVTSLLASPGAALQYTASVGGWAPSTPPTVGWNASSGTITATSPSTATFTPPASLPPNGTTVTINACVTNPPSASCASQPVANTSAQLQVMPVVSVTAAPTSWPAGQPITVTLTGSGWGTSTPSVSVSDTTIKVVPGTVTTSASTQTMPLQVTVPLLDLGNPTLTVTNPSTGSSATIGLSILPAKVALAVAPASGGSLQYGQTQLFTATITCTNGSGALCSLPQTATFSLNPIGGTGSFSPNPSVANANGGSTTTYFAPSPIGFPNTTNVVGTACSTSLPALCGQFSLSLVPISITISPTASSASPLQVASGKTQQFSATVTNYGNASAQNSVNWYVNSTLGGSSTYGTITSTGLYTAPIVTTNMPVTVMVASQADLSRQATTYVSVGAMPPAITGMNPTSDIAGDSTGSISFYGTNLGPNPAVNNSCLKSSPASLTLGSITYSSNTQINIAYSIPSTALATTCTLSVTTPNGTSNSESFTINAKPQLPTLAGISLMSSSGVPLSSAPQCSSGYASIYGQNLTNGTVAVGGSGVSMQTTYVSAGQINVSYSVSCSAAITSYSVDVTTPAGTSNPVTFNVSQGPPQITGMNPTADNTGNSGSINFYGTDFGPSAVVNNSCPSSTLNLTGMTYNSNTVISEAYSIPSTAPAATCNLSVTTQYGTSSPQVFTVRVPPPPQPSIAGITLESPSGASLTSAAQGSSGYVVIYGSNLVNGTPIVSLNGGTGTTFSVTYPSAGQVNAYYTVPSTAPVGTYSLTVTTGSGTSNAVAFTITAQ